MRILSDLRDLAASILDAKRNWSRKNGREKCLLLHKIGKVSGDLIGVRFLGDLNVNWWSYSSASICGLYGLLTCYTIYCFTMENRFLECIPSTCISGIVISVGKKSKSNS